MTDPRFKWQPDYSKLAMGFFRLHFGEEVGLSVVFPCDRDEYPWGDHRPSVLDSRVPAKNNTEYHGLEKYACQYFATAQYEYAYHHWLLAAFWRDSDSDANDFSDPRHEKAIEYCLRQALYNEQLFRWQQSPSETSLPRPEDFGLTEEDLARKEARAINQIAGHMSNET